jgi:hypothetical protein
MSSSITNRDFNQQDEQIIPRTENSVDPFVDEELPGTLDSSGGSAELQAPHLQASTVTFTGVPSSPTGYSVPPVEVATELPIVTSPSRPVDIPCM